MNACQDARPTRAQKRLHEQHECPLKGWLGQRRCCWYEGMAQRLGRHVTGEMAAAPDWGKTTHEYPPEEGIAIGDVTRCESKGMGSRGVQYMVDGMAQIIMHLAI